MEKSGEIRIDKEGLLKSKPLKTWAYELFQPYGFNPAISEMIIGSLDKDPGNMFYSPTHRLLVDRKELIIVPVAVIYDEKLVSASYYINGPESGELESPVHLTWTLIQPGAVSFEGETGSAYFDLDNLAFPLEIRKWHFGDYFYPLGMKGKKKLSDYFIDQKISRQEKENVWILCSKGQVAWIIGYRQDNRFKIKPGTKNIFLIRKVT